MTDSPKVFLVREGIHGEEEDTALASGLAIVGFLELTSMGGTTDSNAVFKIVEANIPSAKAGSGPRLWRMQG